MRVPGVRFVQGRNRYGTSTKYAIAVHATANTASAANEAAYATRRTDGTSSHFYADALEVIQSLDTTDRAGHAGSTEGNTYAIAVEFTGLNSWSRTKWLESVAWDRIGAVLAVVSKAHSIPATRASVAQMKANARVRGAYDHNQMRLAWGATDHTDPGPNFPWDHLLAVWQQHLSGESDDMTEADRKLLIQSRDASVEAVRLCAGIRDVVAKLGGVIAAESSSPDEVRTLLAGLPGTDEPAIIAGVLAGLTAADIAAAIPTDIAGQVAAELAARLQG